MKSMETGRQDGGSDKNHAPFSVGKTGNISRKFLTIILKIFDKNFERLHVYREKTVDRKEKISRKITTAFHSKEINMKNVIYYSVNNKRIFMK